MGDLIQRLDDFGAGIYRGREAPAGAVYDAVNALVDDEGQLFKRGTSALHSTSDASSDLYRLHALYMRAPAANRVLARRVGSTNLQVLDAALAPVELAGDSDWSRPASVGDYAIFAVGGKQTLYYGGSQKVAYNTGTLSATNGDDDVTGSGTSWTANVDPGMILKIGSSYGVVQQVTSNTALKLASPWAYPTVSGSAYNLGGVQVLNIGAIPLALAGVRGYVAAAGSRLLFCVGNRVYFTPADDPFTFDENSYHGVPANALIVGAEGMGDVVLIFTTRGVWRISNLSFDAVDDAGNVQHIVDQVSKDVVLWDDYGISAFDQGLVVPALDDVYLMSLDGEAVPVSAAIRSLYRGYVDAGYQPGQAVVHRGHLLLPIMNGTTLVDELVCRLDRAPRPWTRWAGHAASPAFAVLVEEAAREPKLLGVKGARVTDLTACLDTPSPTMQDADSTTPVFRVDTSDVALGGVRGGTAEMMRLTYETQGGTPTVSVGFAVNQDGGFTAATLKRGGGASTGNDYSAWKLTKRAQRVRFRIECSSQVQALILRRAEIEARRRA